MTFAEHVAGWEALHGVPASPLVRRWLRGVHVVARRLPVAPWVLTLLGVVLAAGSVVGWAVPLVVASVACDALDGAVAVLRSRTTAWGARLDTAADRVCDVLFVVALGTGWWAVVPAVAVVAFEGLRPRPVTLTVAERPQRVLAVLLGLLTVGWLGWAAWVVLLAVGAVQLQGETRS